MMGLMLLTERHAQQIAGVLSCYDRVIVQGRCRCSVTPMG